MVRPTEPRAEVNQIVGVCRRFVKTRSVKKEADEDDLSLVDSSAEHRFLVAHVGLVLDEAIRERERVVNGHSRHGGDLQFAAEKRCWTVKEVGVVLRLGIVGGIGRQVGEGNTCGRTQDEADGVQAKVDLEVVDRRVDYRATLLLQSLVAEGRRREKPRLD